MAHIIYVQSSGCGYSWDSTNETPLFQGYSGDGEHRDNPASQCLMDRGPIPVGWYDMSLIEDYNGMPNVVRLTPDPSNNMCGRSGFLIHGDSKTNPGNASKGCIVLNGEDVRKKLVEKFDRLHVVAYDRSDLVNYTLSEEPPVTVVRDEKKPTESKLPFYLGFGYKSHALSFGNRIINHKAVTESPEPADAKVVDNFGILVSQEDFESALSVDASISGSGESFSASVRASFRQRYQRSQTSVTIAFTRKVIAGIFRLAQFPVEKDAKNESKDPLRFIRSYGDNLVTGIGVGGACSYMFRFDFHSEREATEFKLAISARYGSGSGSYSQEQKQKIERVNASISFSGYTTGTLSVPDLFPEEIKDGTNFLFSRDFGGQMISGLLKYYDSFPSNFKLGTVETGYSQCERETKSLSGVPKILHNQDKIVDVGSIASSIAEALRAQLDYLSALEGQLRYVPTIVDCNIESANNDAAKLIVEVSKIREKVEKRLEQVIRTSDIKSPFDFRAEFPTLPKYLCTADPDVRESTRNSPNGWRNYSFEIAPDDYDHTLWIRASVSICAVGHRPNGGTIEIKLIKTILPQPSASKMHLPTVGATLESDKIVEHKRQTIRRGQTASLTVGEFAFIPSRDNCIYRLEVSVTGDYRCGSTTNIVTKKSKQSDIIF